MRNLFGRDRGQSVITSIAWGVGGMIVGATAAVLLTPATGSQMRALIRGLFARPEHQDELADQHAAMENEGGVSHVVSPPSPTLGETRSH